MRECENAMFALQKVKITKDGGLAVNYTMVEQKENETYVNKHRIQANNMPHADLMQLFVNLQPIVATVFNLSDWKPLFVNGITIGGKNESEGAIITANFMTSAGQETTIATPRLKYHTNAYGFEEELSAIVAGIENEVYKYLFEEKTAVLDTFNAD
jgi:hypothetical protein